MTPVNTIATVRDATCGLMRIERRVKHTEEGSKENPRVADSVTYEAAFVGTAWCIVEDEYLVTAQHVLGKSDDDVNRYAFTAPGNGPVAHPFRVEEVVLEDPAVDVAVLRISVPPEAQHHVRSVPVTFTRPPDGTSVLTYGFPSPLIENASVDAAGNWRGGRFLMKAHANEGIVSSQYELRGAWHFEFNVGWHHGESGGPVLRHDPVAVFAVMQQYRNIQTPHGVVAGPHLGRSLDVVRQKLVELGAEIIE